MDYYELVVQRNEQYVRFIKHDLSTALEAASAIVMVCAKEAYNTEIDIYKVDTHRRLLEVHIEA